MAKPWNADSLTYDQVGHARAKGIDSAHNFVAGNDWNFRVRQFTVNNMQIGATHTAGSHLYSNLAGSGLPIGKLLPLKGRLNLCKHHGFHGALLFCAGCETGGS